MIEGFACVAIWLALGGAAYGTTKNTTIEGMVVCILFGPFVFGAAIGDRWLRVRVADEVTKAAERADLP